MRIQKYLFGLLLGLALATAWSASAQALPPIREFYFDTDAAAAPIVLVDPAQADAVDQLARQRTRGRRAVEASVQLANIAAADNRVELADSLYQEALTGSAPNSTIGRGVRWNMGWHAFRQGRHEQAQQLWLQALEQVRGEPSWAPPTLALVLHRQGNTDEAVKWYAAAVRTEPQLWIDPANFERLLPHWQPAERQALEQVHQAWVANPPSWP